jgi:hypothetical protein
LRFSDVDFLGFFLDIDELQGHVELFLLQRSLGRDALHIASEDSGKHPGDGIVDVPDVVGVLHHIG